MEQIRSLSNTTNFFKFAVTNKTVWKLLGNGKLKSALDLGTEYGKVLYFLYHQFNYNKLVGVELLKEIELAKKLKIIPQDEDQLEEFLENLTMHDIYQASFKLEGEFKDKQVKKENFNNMFSFYTDTGIISFFNKNDDSFDLIIASNILHFVPISQFFNRQPQVIKDYTNYVVVRLVMYPHRLFKAVLPYIFM